MPSNRLHLLSPAGFRAGAVYAGIKTRQTPDVGLLVCDVLATAAAVFTTNKVFAAPVKVGREHLRRRSGKLRGVVVNAGNANACTGPRGERDARRMCQIAAEMIECDPREILPSSTGIIGHHLPMDHVELGIRGAAANLGNDPEHAHHFADAILTTDLKRKAAAATFKVGSKTVTIAGVCKGSGMIGPRMATMLAYLTTDAAIAPPLLRKLMAAATESSFNAVTVDDHTSTNDTACILASGLCGAHIDSAPTAARFAAALTEVCQSLAYQIAADGEGATRVITITVRQAKNDAAARTIARAIANSPLVKCAMHGHDPNWGRIVSAAGMAGVAFDPEKCTLTLQGTAVFRAGQPVKFDTTKLSADLKRAEVKVDLACRLGTAEATCWTCDLSKDYVTINADYHT
jgi:glutamate N-acetyltransferase/amino-acid N-acetyltransferase